MKIWVGVTDKDWFQFLSRINADEVNFWQPSGSRVFRALQPGEPFLFKLHSPDNFIVGGGHFVRLFSAADFARLGCFRAEERRWLRSMISMPGSGAIVREDASVDPVIGCNVLAEPFFFPRGTGFLSQQNWAPEYRAGQDLRYDVRRTAEALWEAVHAALTRNPRVGEPPMSQRTPMTQNRFGAEYLTRGRLGQGAFRVLVTDAYERRCAVTGEKTLPVLEAAHIKPYALLWSSPSEQRNSVALGSAQAV